MIHYNPESVCRIANELAIELGIADAEKFIFSMASLHPSASHDFLKEKAIACKRLELETIYMEEHTKLVNSFSSQNYESFSHAEEILKIFNSKYPA